MGIKLIAVDMDGTFLSSDKTYHSVRFANIYREMKEQGIRFVVASGNQYYQLRSFFPEIQAEIAFVSENGGLIVDQEERLFVGEISSQVIKKVYEVIENCPDVATIVCGARSAYMLESESPEFFKQCRTFYHRLQPVVNYQEIHDQIIKFALVFPGDQVPEAIAYLTQELKGLLIPVSSGHGAVDLITPGIHKAHGLQLLQKRWGIEEAEIAAFGDSGNDLEMIEYATYGYAMKNAAPAIIEASNAITEYDNNQDGVLVEIEKLLGI